MAIRKEFGGRLPVSAEIKSHVLLCLCAKFGAFYFIVREGHFL